MGNGRVAAFVSAMGSAGTIAAGDRLKSADPACKIVAVEPVECPTLYNVGYVLLHPAIEQRYPYADTWQASWDFVKATLPLEPTPFWTGDGIEAYRVVLPPVTDSFRLDLGTPGTFAYRGEGWVAGRSHCEHCRTKIAWYDMLPVFSYALLGGKCRSCKHPIPILHPVVELMSGMLFVWWY